MCHSHSGSGNKRGKNGRLADLLRAPALWLQAGIVVCAYCGYKGLDNYALYAHQVLGMTEAGAAQFTATAAYIRPAGSRHGRVGGRPFQRHRGYQQFVCCHAGGLWLTQWGGRSCCRSHPCQSAGDIFLPCLRCVVFTLRCFIKVGCRCPVPVLRWVWYRLLAIRLISSLRRWRGRILDTTPGVGGHQNYFVLLSAIAIGGLMLALLLSVLIKRDKNTVVR